MPTIKDLTNFVLNRVESKEIYEYMKNNNLLNDDELYLVQDDTPTSSVVIKTWTVSDV